MGMAKVIVNPNGEVTIEEEAAGAGAGDWVTATLINSYNPPVAPKITPRYRLIGDSLEIDGDVDISEAISGTAAFILDVDYWRDHDIDYASVRDDDGTKFFASVYVDSTNGEVRLYW